MLTVLGLSIGLVVGVLFVASGSQKIRTGDIVESAARYEILPDRVVAVLLPTLPWIEVGLGILSSCPGIAATYALLAAASLLTLFAIGMAVNLVRGRRIDCGCRAARRPISWRLVGENVGLAGAAGLAALTQSQAPLRELIGGTTTLTKSEIVLVILLVSQVVVLYCIALAIEPLRRQLRLIDTYQAFS